MLSAGFTGWALNRQMRTCKLFPGMIYPFIVVIINPQHLPASALHQGTFHAPAHQLHAKEPYAYARALLAAPFTIKEEV
jgi:hypothetical protein